MRGRNNFVFKKCKGKRNKHILNHSVRPMYPDSKSKRYHKERKLWTHVTFEYKCKKSLYKILTNKIQQKHYYKPQITPHDWWENLSHKFNVSLISAKSVNITHYLNKKIRNDMIISTDNRRGIWQASTPFCDKRHSAN